MHFAAFAYVGESVKQPEKYFHNNVTKSLLSQFHCGIRSAPRGFSSSCATYGTPSRIPIAEDAPQRPVNPYGETKLIMERALHWYAGRTISPLRRCDISMPRERTSAESLERCTLRRRTSFHWCFRRLMADGRWKLWGRLPNSRWELRARLHSCSRSGRCPC